MTTRRINNYEEDYGAYGDDYYEEDEEEKQIRIAKEKSKKEAEAKKKLQKSKSILDKLTNFSRASIRC